MRLWSERIASILRVPDKGTRATALQQLFDLDVTLDLVPALQSFVDGFSVLVHHEEFDDIENRVYFMTEAFESVDAALPNTSKGHPGTAVGSTLWAFPAGRSLIESYRLALSKAVVTNQKLRPFQAKLQSFYDSLMALTGFLGCHSSVLDALSGLGAAISVAFSGELTAILPDFMPDAGHPRVKEPMTLWLTKLQDAIVECLGGVVKVGATKADLSSWMPATENARARLRQCSEVTTSLRALMEDSPLLRFAQTGVSLCKWLEACRSFLAHPLSFSVEQLQDMQRHYRACVQPLEHVPHGAADFSQALLAFQRSTLLASDGEYVQAVNSSFSHAGAAHLTDALDQFRSILGMSPGSGPFHVVALEALSTDALQAISIAEFNDEPYNRACEWSRGFSDDLLRVQLQALHHTATVHKHLAAAEVVARQYFQRGLPMKDRCVRAEQMDALQAARCRVAALEQFGSSRIHIFDASVVASAAVHVPHADGLLNFRSVLSSVVAEAHRVEKMYQDAWTSDIQKLMDGITAVCPKWEGREESLMTDVAVVRSFLEMSPKHVDGLTSFCVELKRQVKALQKSNVAGIMAPQLMKLARATVDHGVKSAVFRAVVVCTHREWLTLTDQEACERAVKKLRLNIKDKYVQLPEQMEDALTAWENGDKLKEMAAGKSAVEATGTLAKSPSSGDLSDVGSCISASGQSQPAPTSPCPSARQGLAARAAMAKRRKLV